MSKGSRITELVQAFRIIVIIPREGGHVEKVINAILGKDALQYGEGYDHVLWESALGIESYRSLKGSNPTHGKEGEQSSVPSIEIAFTIPRKGAREKIQLMEILNVIADVHPWEEPEIFISEVVVSRCASSKQRKLVKPTPRHKI